MYVLIYYTYSSFPFVKVTGDSNFSMESTSLIIGGFSQPSVAKALIKQSGSAEIGFAQCILWVFPQPAYSCFNTLNR